RGAVRVGRVQARLHVGRGGFQGGGDGAPWRAEPDHHGPGDAHAPGEGGAERGHQQVQRQVRVAQRQVGAGSGGEGEDQAAGRAELHGGGRCGGDRADERGGQQGEGFLPRPGGTV